MEVAHGAATGVTPLGSASNSSDKQQHESANPTAGEANDGSNDSKSKKKKKKKKKNRRKSVEKTQAEVEAAQAAAAAAAAHLEAEAQRAAKSEQQPQDEEGYEATVKVESANSTEPTVEAEKEDSQTTGASINAKEEPQTAEPSNQAAEQTEPAVEMPPELETAGKAVEEVAKEDVAVAKAEAADEPVKAEEVAVQDAKSETAETAENEQETVGLETLAPNNSSEVKGDSAAATEKPLEPIKAQAPVAEEASMPSPPSEEALVEPLVVQAPASESAVAPTQSPSNDAKKAPSSSNSPVRSLMSRFTTKLGRKKAPSRSESLAKLENATPSPVKSAVKRLEVHEETSLDDLTMRTKRDFFGSDEERSIHVSAEKEKYDALEKQRKREEEAAAAVAAAKQTPPSSTSSATAAEVTEPIESAEVGAPAVELKEVTGEAVSESAVEGSTEQAGVQSTTPDLTVVPVETSTSMVSEASSTVTKSNSKTESVASEVVASEKPAENVAPSDSEAAVDATKSSNEVAIEAPTSETEKTGVSTAEATPVASESVAMTELTDASEVEATPEKTTEDVTASTEQAKTEDGEAIDAAVEPLSETVQIPEVPVETAAPATTEVAKPDAHSEAIGDASIDTAKTKETSTQPSESAVEAPKPSEPIEETVAKSADSEVQAEVSTLSPPAFAVETSKPEENVPTDPSTSEPLTVVIAPPAPGSPPTDTKTQSKLEKQSPVKSLASRFEGKQEQSLDSLKFRTVREFFPQERSIRVGTEKQKYESITEQQKLKAKAEEDMKAHRKSGSPHQASKSPSSGSTKALSPIIAGRTMEEPSVVASGAKESSVQGSSSGSPASSDHSTKKEDAGAVTPVKSIASRFEGKREQSLDSLKFRTVREFFPTGDERSIRVGAEKAKYEALSKQQKEAAKLAEEMKSKRANSPPTSGSGKVRATSQASENSVVSAADKTEAEATEKQHDDVPAAETTELITDKESVEASKESSVVEPVAESTGAPVAEEAPPVSSAVEDNNTVDAAGASETPALAVDEDVAVREPSKVAEVAQTAEEEVEPEVAKNAAAVAEQPKDASKEVSTPDQAKAMRKSTSTGSRSSTKRRSDSKSRPMLTTERSFVMDDQTIETEDTVVVSERPMTDDEKDNSALTAKKGPKARKPHQSPASAGTKKSTKTPSPARSSSTPKLTRKTSAGSTVPIPMKRASITAPTASSMAKRDDGHTVEAPASKHHSPFPKPKGTVGPTGFIKPPPAAPTVPVAMKRASITAPTASSQARHTSDHHETKAPHSAPKRHSAKVKGTVGPTGFVKPAPPPPTVPVMPKRASIMAPTASYRAKKAAEEAAKADVTPALNLATRNSRYAKVPSKVLEGLQSGSIHATSKTITKADFIAAERRKSLGSAGVRSVLEADRRASIGGRGVLDIPEPFVRSASQQKKVDKALPRYMDYQNSPAYARVAQEQYERRKRLEESNALKSEKRQKELRMFFADQHQKAMSTAQDEVRRGQELHEYAKLAKESEIAEKKARRKERAQERASRTHDRASVSSSSSGPSQSSSAAPRKTKKPSAASSGPTKSVTATAVETSAVETEVVVGIEMSTQESAPVEVVKSDVEESVEVAVKDDANAEATAVETLVGDEDLALEKVAKKINFDDASSDSDEKCAASP